MSTPAATLIDTILHKPGIGERLMAEYGNMHHLAQNLDSTNLTDNQRATLRAALEIRFVKEREPVQIFSPANIFLFLADLQVEPQEVFVVIALDIQLNILHRENLYRGMVDGLQVRIAEVFRSAILHNASSIVIAHNHPSGNPEPSFEDRELTTKIAEAGKLLGIELLDHIIIGAERCVSLKERGF